MNNPFWFNQNGLFFVLQ